MNIYHKLLRGMILGLMGLSGVSLMVMMGVTCLDIILRRFGHPIHGCVDIVQISACICAITALPYTTAVKGHVAVEFFFQRMPKVVQILSDGFCRLLVCIMFLAMTWRSFGYGCTMFHRHNATMTLHVPLFWLMWVMSFSCLVVAMTKIYNLTHPGKELLKP